MTTTIEQKAKILRLWADNREKRKEAYDVKERVHFNWPSLPDHEVAEVLHAYQQGVRFMGKHVSSPKSPPKHVVKCELGWRRYIEVFPDTNSAKVFIDAVLRGEKTKWASSTELTAKDANLVVRCDELEEIMEFDGKDVWKMPEEMKRQIDAFLLGHWKHNAPKDDNEDEQKTPQRAPKRREAGISNGVTLADICAKHSWEPRRVRIAMRAAKWETPEGGWKWGAKEVPVIEKKLKELMR